MNSFQITVNNDTSKLNQLLAGYLPATIAAKNGALDLIKNHWTQLADSAFKKPTRIYRESIETNQSPQNPFSGEVTATAPHSAVIEYGHSGFSLKKMLYTSNKTRWMYVGKGKNRRLVRALIIPFRHALPSAGAKQGGSNGEAATLPSMPSNIARMAKKMTVSKVTGSFDAKAISRAQAATLVDPGSISPYSADVGAEFGMGESAKRNTYAWGDRLTGTGDDKYEGMVRMANGGGYMTFRVMHEAQPDSMWRVPPRPGQFLAKRTAQDTSPLVKQLILDAFRGEVGQ